MDEELEQLRPHPESAAAPHPESTMKVWRGNRGRSHLQSVRAFDLGKEDPVFGKNFILANWKTADKEEWLNIFK